MKTKCWSIVSMRLKKILFNINWPVVAMAALDTASAVVTDAGLAICKKRRHIKLFVRFI